MMRNLLPADYAIFLAKFKGSVRHARISAARKASQELVLLCWAIGRGIVEKQKTAGWGDAVVERLAADLQSDFPEMRGFSARNIWDMRCLFEAYGSKEFLRQAVAEMKPAPRLTIRQRSDSAKLTAGNGRGESLRQLVAEIPWGHHRLILNKLTNPAARLYYLRATAKFSWARNVLLSYRGILGNCRRCLHYPHPKEWHSTLFLNQLISTCIAPFFPIQVFIPPQNSDMCRERVNSRSLHFDSFCGQ